MRLLSYLSVGLLWAGVAAAQPAPWEPAPPFPNMSDFRAGSIDAVVQNLYKGRTYVGPRGAGICEPGTPPCVVKPLQKSGWKDQDGRDHLTLVLSAAPASSDGMPGPHFASGVVGMVDLVVRPEVDLFHIVAGSPWAAPGNEFGNPPSGTALVPNAPFGQVVVVRTGSMHQGEVIGNFAVYAADAKTRKFRKLVEFPESIDHEGACEHPKDRVCRGADFKATINFFNAPADVGDGLVIRVSKSFFTGKNSEDWYVINKDFSVRHGTTPLKLSRN